LCFSWRRGFDCRPSRRLELALVFTLALVLAAAFGSLRGAACEPFCTPAGPAGAVA
jgi:hypothetical protein